nr:PREDICTED: endoplasmic reticulum membrane-associated RNA degradation protein-like [Bemisia tabaci]
MLATHIGTYLSSYMQNLLVNLSQSAEKNEKRKLILLNDLTLDWTAIAEVTGDVLLDINILQQPTSYFERALTLVWPVYHQIHSEFQEADCSRQGALLSRLHWTEQSDNIIRLHEQYSTSKSNTTKMTLLLLLTSVLERSLGNVLAASDFQVPFLLRDLLQTEYLKSFLGAVPSTFIQLLVGTPRSLNLRNVLWHGFIHPTEISDSLVTVLIVVLASIEALLNSKRFTVNHRKCFDLSKFDGVLEEDSDRLFQTSVLQNLVDTTNIIPPKFKLSWIDALRLCDDLRYGECCLVLLPQIELLLRCAFCTVNNLPSRLLTAEAETLYTTLDQILVPKLTDNEENKLYSVLSADVITMLNDLLTFPNGPRLRDKLSHGEVRVEDISNHLCHHFINVLVHVFMKLQDFSSQDILQICSVQHSNSVDQGLYYPKFHLISVVKRSIDKSVSTIKSWESSLLPEKLNVECLSFGVEQNLNSYLLAVERSRYSEETIQPSFQLLDDFLKSRVLSHHCSILKKFESLKYLMQIADNLLGIQLNVQESLEEKHASLREFELRERGRKTFEKILQILPVLRQCLFAILYLIICNFIAAVLGQDTLNPLRDIKDVLSAVQKMYHFTNRRVNRWLENVRILQTMIIPVLKRSITENVPFEAFFR